LFQKLLLFSIYPSSLYISILKKITHLIKIQIPALFKIG
jgi:hypothetical protein